MVAYVVAAGAFHVVAAGVAAGVTDPAAGTGSGDAGVVACAAGVVAVVVAAAAFDAD